MNTVEKCFTCGCMAILFYVYYFLKKHKKGPVTLQLNRSVFKPAKKPRESILKPSVSGPELMKFRPDFENWESILNQSRSSTYEDFREEGTSYTPSAVYSRGNSRRASIISFQRQISN